MLNVCERADKTHSAPETFSQGASWIAGFETNWSNVGIPLKWIALSMSSCRPEIRCQKVEQIPLPLGSQKSEIPGPDPGLELNHVLFPRNGLGLTTTSAKKPAEADKIDPFRVKWTAGSWVIGST